MVIQDECSHSNISINCKLIPEVVMRNCIVYYQIRRMFWSFIMVTWSNGNIFLVTGPFLRSPVNSPHKGQPRVPLISSLICAWTNHWVNNREAGDLRCHCAHCDVIVMQDHHVRNIQPQIDKNRRSYILNLNCPPACINVCCSLIG